MSYIQYFFAIIILFFILFVGTFFLFKKPLPYAYDNLNDSLTKTMRQNGVFWAKVSVDGNNVKISGTAPSTEALVFVKSLVQSQSGITVKMEDIVVDKTSSSLEPTHSAENSDSIAVESATSEETTRTDEDDNYTVSDSFPNDNSKIERPTYILLDKDIEVFHTAISSDCEDSIESNVGKFTISFKDLSPAITANSIGLLDNIAQYNRNCPREVRIINAAHVEPGSLSSRRVDEIRYYLMSSGISVDNIILD